LKLRSIYLRSCRSYAESEYALPEIVDSTQNMLSADFEAGVAPIDAVDAIAKKFALVSSKDWTLEQAMKVMKPFMAHANANGV
jgi:hypothetical protein